MFDRPGIGIEDLPWIHRDQFVHYTQLAYVLSDPQDWLRLRQDLMRALTAAFGLDVGDVKWRTPDTAPTTRAGGHRRDPPPSRPRK